MSRTARFERLNEQSADKGNKERAADAGRRTIYRRNDSLASISKNICVSANRESDGFPRTSDRCFLKVDFIGKKQEKGSFRILRSNTRSSVFRERDFRSTETGRCRPNKKLTEPLLKKRFTSDCDSGKSDFRMPRGKDLTALFSEKEICV